MLSLLPAASPFSSLSLQPHHAFKVVPSSPFNATMMQLQQQQQQAAAAQFLQSYKLLPSAAVAPITPPSSSFPRPAFSPKLPYSADFAQQPLLWTPQKRLCLPPRDSKQQQQQQQQQQQSVTSLLPVAAIDNPEQDKKQEACSRSSPPDVTKPTALRLAHRATDAVVTAVAAAPPSALARRSIDSGDCAPPAWRSVLFAHMRSLLTKADGEVDGSSLSPAHRSLLVSIKSDRAPASPLLLSQRPLSDSPSSRISSSDSSLCSPVSTAGSLSSGAVADAARSDNEDSGEDGSDGDDDDDDCELEAEAACGRSMQENQQQQTASLPCAQPRPVLCPSVSAATPLMLSCVNGFNAGVVCCSTASVSSSCSPRKRRISKACIACRRRKRKCDGRSPSCSSCQRLQQRCDYPVSRRRGPQVGMLQKRRAELRQRSSSSSRPAELSPNQHQHAQHSLPQLPMLLPYALPMQPMPGSVFPRPAMASQPWPPMSLQR